MDPKYRHVQRFHVYELSVHAHIKFNAEPYPVLVAMDSVYNFLLKPAVVLLAKQLESQTRTEFNKSFILHITHFLFVCLYASLR